MTIRLFTGKEPNKYENVNIYDVFKLQHIRIVLSLVIPQGQKHNEMHTIHRFIQQIFTEWMSKWINKDITIKTRIFSGPKGNNVHCELNREKKLHTHKEDTKWNARHISFSIQYWWFLYVLLALFEENWTTNYISASYLVQNIDDLTPLDHSNMARCSFSYYLKSDWLLHFTSQ